MLSKLYERRSPNFRSQTSETSQTTLCCDLCDSMLGLVVKKGVAPHASVPLRCRPRQRWPQRQQKANNPNIDLSDFVRFDFPLCRKIF
jgi:hypothetical protein